MRSKIIATLGPASMNHETMRAMVEYGVRIFRLNFSHSDAATFVPIVKIIKEIEAELNVPLTILGDLCGPKIRIGEVKGSPRQVDKSETVCLGLADQRGKSSCDVFIELDMPELLKGLEPGMPVSLSDGMLQFCVSKTLEDGALYEITANNGGILTSHKGIAFPGKYHPLPALTDKDRKDLHEALDVGVNALAISFVQSMDDIRDIKDEIKRHGTWVPVVAKIERANAVENIDSILSLTDVIMVARGDLGLECPIQDLPVIQKRLIRAARHAQKGCIVATQMLLSMVKNPVPTRAEATDVANAIMDGADCVMLSEETAIGAYPVEAVKFMNSLAQSAEGYYLERLDGPYKPSRHSDPVKFLAYSAALMAQYTGAKAIVSHSTSGATARLLASRRPEQMVYSLTPDKNVVPYLNFFWSVNPRLSDTVLESHVDRVQQFVDGWDEFAKGDCVIITSGQPTPGQKKIQTNELKVYYK
jgi:pyruvate kinase